MVLTDFPRVAERILDFRDYDKKEVHRFRTNSKMTDLEAAMGIEQLKKISNFVERRRQIARLYREILSETGMILPTEDSNRDHVYFRYVVRIPRKAKDEFRRLEESGVEVKKPVYKPLHQYLGLSDTSFPHTARAMRESCSLPIYPSLRDEEWKQIHESIFKIKDFQHRKGELTRIAVSPL